MPSVFVLRRTWQDSASYVKYSMRLLMLLHADSLVDSACGSVRIDHRRVIRRNS